MGRKTAAPMAIWTACQKLAPRSGLSIIWLMTCTTIAFAPMFSGAPGHSPLLAGSAVSRPQSLLPSSRHPSMKCPMGWGKSWPGFRKPAALTDSCLGPLSGVLADCPPIALGSPRRNTGCPVRLTDISERACESRQGTFKYNQRKDIRA